MDSAQELQIDVSMAHKQVEIAGGLTVDAGIAPLVIALNQLGDVFTEHYHKRSNVETTFHMIKAKFGIALRSKTKTAQINEVLCKVLAHNICCLIQSMFELNVKPEFWNEVA